MAETAAVDFVLMANHVEVVNGLLYVSGGGWTDHHRRLPPDGAPIPPSHLGIGVSVVVPWNEKNRTATPGPAPGSGGHPNTLDRTVKFGRAARRAPVP